jgi:hypothetical protein
MKSAVVLTVFTLFLVLLASCSSIKGVTISEQERAVCETTGCSVWTLDEIRALVSRAFRAGHAVGYKDGVKSL